MAYGTYAVDVEWLKCLHEITLHFTNNAGICGISTRTKSGTYTFGLEYCNATSLSLKHSEEFITQIIVFKFSGLILR